MNDRFVQRDDSDLKEVWKLLQRKNAPARGIERAPTDVQLRPPPPGLEGTAGPPVSAATSAAAVGKQGGTWGKRLGAMQPREWAARYSLSRLLMYPCAFFYNIPSVRFPRRGAISKGFVAEEGKNLGPLGSRLLGGRKRSSRD